MLSQNLIIWYAGAIIFGGIVAFVTIAIFRRLAPTGTTRQYWSNVGTDIHGLLYGEEDAYWRHYISIIRRTGKYVGQQLFAVVIAFAPLVIAFFVIGPWIFAQWDRGAERTVVPAYAGTLSSLPGNTADDSTESQRLTLADGTSVAVPPISGSLAFCEPGRFACFVLQGFGFTVVTVESTGSPEIGFIVVRTAHADWNPLWPYLSDPEFLFFMSLFLGSILFFVRKGKATEAGAQEYSINLIDYVLTLLATRNMGFMRKVGDFESRRYAKRLDAISIFKPVFIAGLARSGTTILLEKLSSQEKVATHRYRDFPFIMTPIIWNRFLRIFGSKQSPSERPHQDKIKITRDSPDAFEEPLWQHFFPFLHESSRQHILSAETQNEEFATFYRQHIQKILLLRDGTRYLSKGNYNLSRIGYIAEMYPDAAFLVPIRHPLTHVESLVRQHELFGRYAETDPKIPNYLRAVGHYEFGPQRAPIHISDTGTKEIETAWANGDDFLGYAIQWREVYEHIVDIFENNPNLAERIRIIRFEDLCKEPQAEFARILDFIDLGSDVSAAQLADGIEASSHRCKIPSDVRDRCWQSVAGVANCYGYSSTLEEIPAFSGIPSRRMKS